MKRHLCCVIELASQRMPDSYTSWSTEKVSTFNTSTHLTMSAHQQRLGVLCIQQIIFPLSQIINHNLDILSLSQLNKDLAAAAEQPTGLRGTVDFGQSLKLWQNLQNCVNMLIDNTTAEGSNLNPVNESAYFLLVGDAFVVGCSVEESYSCGRFRGLSADM